MSRVGLLLWTLLFVASCGGGKVQPREEDDGIQREYWNNGKLKMEAHYAEGQLDGPYKTWYDNGQMFQDGQYAEGMMDGSWLVFYPNGQLASKALYDKGTGKQTCYNEDGCIIMEVNYVDNVKHGKEVHYAWDGTVVEEVEYRHGEKYLH